MFHQKWLHQTLAQYFTAEQYGPEVERLFLILCTGIGSYQQSHP
jgi:hypothetical protein